MVKYSYGGKSLSARIDIDHCIKDGKISDDANYIIDSVNSYTEKSPSSTGIHIYVKGTIPKNIL